MKIKSISKKLHDMFLHAIGDLELVSEILIEDEDNADQSVELLTMEALYSAACFSRAVRGTGTFSALGPRIHDLHDSISHIISLMSGDGAARVAAYAQDYFTASRITASINAIDERFNAAFEANALDELVTDDDFEEQVFDLFLFRDRFACLSHPADCPVNAITQRINTCRTDMQWVYNTLLPVFTVFSNNIVSFRDNTFIPDESAYRFWHQFSNVSAEDILHAFEKAYVQSHPEAFVLAALLKLVPKQMAAKIRQIGIDKRCKEILGKLGGDIRDIIDQLKDALLEPPSMESPTWSYDSAISFYRTDRSIECKSMSKFSEDLKEIDEEKLVKTSDVVNETSPPETDGGLLYVDSITPDHVRTIILKNRPALQNYADRIEKDPQLAEEEKRELLIMVSLFLNDRENLNSLLSKDT